LKDIFVKRDNVEDIIRDIKSLNPTIITFQEFPTIQFSPETTVNEFKMELKKLNYQQVVFGHDGGLGNAIYSKIPSPSIATKDLGHRRYLARATFDYRGLDLHLFTTHLDVWDSTGNTRLDEAKIVLNEMKYIQEMDREGKIILTGDFNDYRDSAPLRLIKSTGLLDVHDIIKWNPPNYTCWAGTEIDFMIASSTLKNDIQGIYVYHTTSSDHLPLVLDLAVE